MRINVNAHSLKSFVEDEESKISRSPVEAKKEIAFNLGISISTLYAWLRSGNYYVEYIEASECGDDSALTIWKEEKLVQ